MKVKEFIEQFNNAAEKDKERQAKKIVATHYLKYETKIGIAQTVVRLSSYENDGTTFRINSPQRYLLFVQAVITHYTTLEIGKDDTFLDIYNMLDQAGAIEFILDAIGEDVDSLRTVISMTLDDFMTNERDLPSYLDHKMDAIMEVLSSITPQEQEQQNGEE